MIIIPVRAEQRKTCPIVKDWNQLKWDKYNFDNFSEIDIVLEMVHS